MRRALFPQRCGSLVAAVVVIALVTLVQTQAVFGWAPVRWTSVSSLAREALLLTGPVAAALGAYIARINATVVTAFVPGKSWSSIVHHHLRVVIGAVLLGFGLGLAPAWVVAAQRATSGGPSLTVILSGFAGVAALTVVGYLVGSMVAAPTGVLVAAVLGLTLTGGLMFLSDSLTSGGIPVSLFSVAPFWTFPFGNGSHEVWQVAAFRTVLFAGFALTLVRLVPHLLDRRLQPRGTRIGQVAWPLVAPLILVVTALFVQPSVVAPDAEPRLVCRDISSGSVCLYQEDAALLEDTVAAINGSVQRWGLGALSGRFTSVRVEQLRTPLVPGDLLFTPQVIYDRSWFQQALRYDVALGIAGSDACFDTLFERYGSDFLNSGPRGAREGYDVTEFAAREMARREGVQDVDEGLVLARDEGSGDNPATKRLEQALAGLSDADLRTWLSVHADDLRRCTVRPEDLDR